MAFPAVSLSNEATRFELSKWLLYKRLPQTLVKDVEIRGSV